MATETTFLNLVLPGLGEFTDSWHEPVNGNFDALDGWAQGINSEVVDARFGKASIKAFLEVAHNTNGSLKPMPEIISAQNSPVYGDQDPGVPPTAFTLSRRLNLGDLEVQAAREGRASLRDALAARQVLSSDMIISGSKDSLGNPTWLSASGDQATVNGSVTPVLFMIGGYIGRIRTNKQVQVTGPAGWYHLYVEYQPTGVQTVDGDASTPPPASSTGSTTLDTDGKKRWFNDTAHVFSGVLKDVDVEPGDTLTIFPPTVGSVPEAGSYTIKALGTGGESNLEIVGLFPGTAGLSGLNYEIRDPLAVTLGVVADAAKVQVDGRLYIGEIYFDGIAVLTTDPSTPLRPYHYRDTYVGGWRLFDLSSTSHKTEIWEHRLGSDILDVSIQVSQANDGSLPIEELSLSGIKNTLGTNVVQPTINVVNTTTLTPNTPQVLSGNVTASASGSAVSLTGAVVSTRSALVQWTRNQIHVKNTTPQLLYTDFGGAEQQSGYVRVVVRKRG